MEARFGRYEGVISTRVGYTEGDEPAPTYHDIDGHTEAVRVEYDPAVLSYQDLLDRFFESRNPHLPAWKRQYMSAVFAVDAEQERAARQKVRAVEEKEGGPVRTKVLAAGPFRAAEDYHQKFYLQQHREALADLAQRHKTFWEFEPPVPLASLSGVFVPRIIC
ncbi:MAG: peptide-methionine (S)-S-oxide reductase [Deltaproteobacteria bacterium]|nr:peptide-methionine (S)-S-oxide reductase [Deltaproteobacteria bacterium]